MIIKGSKARLLSRLAAFFLIAPTCSASGTFYAGASVAASFAQLGNNTPQISYFSGDVITDSYPLKDNTKSSTIFSANGGYEFNRAAGKPAIALGLGVYSNPGDYKYNGQVLEMAAGDPIGVLYNYQYKVDSTRIMAEIQCNWMLAKVAPFVNAGIGPAWNRLARYREMAIDNTSYPPLPPFQSQTSSNFAYQVGIGLSKVFNLQKVKDESSIDRVSLGYRYANLGNTSFGTRGPAYPFALKTGWLQTNDVYLSYTHLF